MLIGHHASFMVPGLTSSKYDDPVWSMHNMASEVEPAREDQGEDEEATDTDDSEYVTDDSNVTEVVEHSKQEGEGDAEALGEGDYEVLSAPESRASGSAGSADEFVVVEHSHLTE